MPASVKETKEGEEVAGKLSYSNVDKKLMRSVLKNDKKTIDQANLIKESINKGMGAFSPDLMFEQMVDNFAMVKSIFGPSIIRQLTGYDDNYIEKNVRIPEFMKELKRKMQENVNKLQKDGILNRQNEFTEKATELAALSCFIEEIDSLIPRGLIGKKLHKKNSVYGAKNEIKTFRKGDRYKDIALKSSVKAAIRRNHTKIDVGDLRTFTRQSKGQISMIFAIDSSGSMKGNKIGTCKKAGVALAYRAIEEKDKVGLIVFGSEVKESIAPTDNLSQLIKSIVNIKPGKETDIAKTVEKSLELFPRNEATKHLMIITDALPTVGDDPEKKTLRAVELARNDKVTISIVGINLDEKGKNLAEKMIAISEGKLYMVKDLDQIDRIVLQDYYSLG